MLCTGLPKQVGNKTSKVRADRLVLAHSANFIILTLVFVSHKIFLLRLSCSPLASWARGQLLPSAPLSYATGRNLEVAVHCNLQATLSKLLVHIVRAGQLSLLP